MRALLQDTPKKTHHIQCNGAFLSIIKHGCVKAYEKEVFNKKYSKESKEDPKMKEKVLEILRGVRKDVEFEGATALIDDGILDSFDIISIVSDLNDEFGVDITADELEPENFNTVDAIVELIKSLQ